MDLPPVARVTVRQFQTANTFTQVSCINLMVHIGEAYDVQHDT